MNIYKDIVREVNRQKKTIHFVWIECPFCVTTRFNNSFDAFDKLFVAFKK